jgi:hypothetical protein
MYELKPNNPRAMAQGHRQLAIYLAEVEKHFGKGWTTVLDTY